MRVYQFPFGSRTVVFDRVNGLVEVLLTDGQTFVADFDFVRLLAEHVRRS